MHIKIPAEIAVESLLDDTCHISTHECHMVFETVLADILHQLLQFRHLGDNDAAIHAVWIVGHLSLSHVCLYHSLCIVGRR